MGIKSRFEIPGTLIANEFIDDYMANASGEYVKVYLYLLRHAGEEVTVDTIADALNHTEADVKRALAYWEKNGVLCGETSSCVQEKTDSEEKKVQQRKKYTADQISGLSGDEEFCQLLYIVQKYLKKVFTPRDSEVYAYLYDGLGISADLLEYATEYCVQSGHTSLRYIETVILNWHEKGFVTVQEAKAYASSFSKNSFAVMKAFGLTDRKPAATELEMIEKWFKEFGFTKEVVLEACNRTVETTHQPSFKYADRILSGWKKAEVKNMTDVKTLDQKHQEEKTKKRTTGEGEKGGTTNTTKFHNFKERGTDYDALMDDLVLKKYREQG